MSSAPNNHEQDDADACKRARQAPGTFDFSRLHPDQNMTEAEVCAFLRLSRGTVRNKIGTSGDYRDPSFPKPRPMKGAARKGSAIRWRAGDVMDWNRAQGGAESDAPLR